MKTHIAILGGGRLARHLRHYLTLLDLPVSAWARRNDPALNTHSQTASKDRLLATLAPASHALLLVTDAAIPMVLRQYPFLHEKTLVHCSGSLALPGVAGAHPLMTFGGSLYDLERYRRIPFVVDSGYDFEDLLPGLPNPRYTVPVEHKARYHALCVTAGNFSQLLWQAASDGLGELGLPPAVLDQYLQQALDNFRADPATALTGPLSRGDQPTIERNLSSLAGLPLQDLYQAFVRFHGARAAAIAGDTGLRHAASREVAS